MDVHIYKLWAKIYTTKKSQKAQEDELTPRSP